MAVRAVCAGDNCIDRYLPPFNRSFVGGNAVNVAVYLQKHGIPAAYIGVVGDDADGRRTLDALKQRDIDISQVQVLPGLTAYSEIRLGEFNDREFVSEYFGPKPSGFLSPELIEFIGGYDLVHTTLLGGTESDLPQIRQAGQAQISLDYGERYTPEFVAKTLPYVDLAFFSLPEDQAEEASDLARRMFEAGPRLVVVTMGSRGSLVYDGQEEYFQSAKLVEVTDTLGAGDAYIGTFLAYYLQGRPIPECMEQATEAAAVTCTHYGAWVQA